MSIWKQLALCAVVLVAAAAAWVKFFPGAPRSWRPGASTGHAASAAPAETTGAARQGGGSRRDGNGPTLVVAQAVTSATINDRLQAIGTGRANASVTVNPYTSGRLTEFLVQSGAHIDNGPGHRQARFRNRGDRARPRQDRARRRCRQARAHHALAAQIEHRHRGPADRSRARRCATPNCDPRRASSRSTAARSSRRSPASSASCRSRPATTSPASRRSPRSTTAPASSSISGCRSASPRPSRSAPPSDGDADRQSRRTSSTARSSPSTTASTKRAARCGCRRRSPMPTTRCAPACRSRSP